MLFTDLVLNMKFDPGSIVLIPLSHLAYTILFVEHVKLRNLYTSVSFALPMNVQWCKSHCQRRTTVFWDDHGWVPPRLRLANNNTNRYQLASTEGKSTSELRKPCLICRLLVDQTQVTNRFGSRAWETCCLPFSVGKRGSAGGSGAGQSSSAGTRPARFLRAAGGTSRTVCASWTASAHRWRCVWPVRLAQSCARKLGMAAAPGAPAGPESRGTDPAVGTAAVAARRRGLPSPGRRSFASRSSCYLQRWVGKNSCR